MICIVISLENSALLSLWQFQPFRCTLRHNKNGHIGAKFLFDVNHGHIDARIELPQYQIRILL